MNAVPKTNGPARVGIGGPVGSGKTALIEQLIPYFKERGNELAIVTNDLVTREDANQKGMSMAQLSGSVGSYGKKYALGNLFAIDDTKDADATNDHGKKAAPAKPKASKPAESKTSFRRKKKAVEVEGDDDDI